MQPEGSSNNFEFFRWTKGWLWWSQYSNSSHNLFISINLSTVTDPGIPIGAPTLGWVLTFYYRLQWSWEGYGFTSVCLSTGGVGGGGLLPGGAWSWGCAWSWGVCLVGGGGLVSQHALWQTPPPGEMATAADGTHPTGMHSCLAYFLLNTAWKLRKLDWQGECVTSWPPDSPLVKIITTYVSLLQNFKFYSSLINTKCNCAVLFWDQYLAIYLCIKMSFLIEHHYKE